MSEARRDEAKVLLGEYGARPLEATGISAADNAARTGGLAEAQAVFDRLWALAAEEARNARDPVAMSVAVSLNDMIDALAARDAAIRRHVPKQVQFPLFGTFVLLGRVVGSSSWISAWVRTSRSVR